MKWTIEGRKRFEIGFLLISVFLIAICGIVYELSIGNISSYLLGNTVVQYSLTIGTFMFAMGVGSFASRVIQKNLIDAFIFIELAIGVVGGFSAVLLLYGYANLPNYNVVMFTIIMIIGMLIGIEIPVLTRLIDHRYQDLKISISNALGFDYIGALIGSVGFSVFLLPKFGVIATSYLLGVINLIVVLLNLAVYYRDIRYKKTLIGLTLVSLTALSYGLLTAQTTSIMLEQELYRDKIIYMEQSKYQKIVMTRDKEDVRLFIDGNIQFSSIDEYRYHEALVHPAMSLVKSPRRVLVLGGGDGLAVREILKYSTVDRIDLVDLDERMTSLAKTHKRLLALNKDALSNKKVHIYNQDAYQFLEQSKELYDVILIDLPDPNNEALNKLYSGLFYKRVGQHLTETGMVSIQSTSPYFAPDVYWCIRKTVESTGLTTTGYHIEVPSFGDWGFTMASKQAFDPKNIQISVETRFLDNSTAAALFLFAKDLSPRDVKANTITNPVILEYYAKSWKYWN